MSWWWWYRQGSCRNQRRERERGGRWQVWGWAFLMVVTAVAGRKADGVDVAGGEPQAGAQRVTAEVSK